MLQEARDMFSDARSSEIKIELYNVAEDEIENEITLQDFCKLVFKLSNKHLTPVSKKVLSRIVKRTFELYELRGTKGFMLTTNDYQWMLRNL